MPINPLNKCELVSVSKTYVDLRHLADDKTVLENPHKGWYYHFVDNGMKRPVYRDRLTMATRMIGMRRPSILQTILPTVLAIGCSRRG